MFPTPVLRSERLVLRPYARGDADSFRTTFTDVDVSRYMAEGVPPTVDEADALFTRVLDVIYPGALWPVWVVTYGGAAVGHAEIKPSPSDRVDGWEVVYALRSQAWGSGLGTEVARRVTAYAHDGLGHEIVHATVDPANAGSLAVLLRLGYADEPDLLDEHGVVTRHLTHQVGGASLAAEHGRILD